MEPVLCFIRETYFVKNESFKKMLDSGNICKQSRRTHLRILIEVDDNKFYIPLRNNLGAEVRKYGRIGHAVPSATRNEAGLDFRYALIVNDDMYIEYQNNPKIPNSQYMKIKSDYEAINLEFATYLRGFLRAANKGRIHKEPLYRESSLINFKEELRF